MLALWLQLFLIPSGNNIILTTHGVQHAYTCVHSYNNPCYCQLGGTLVVIQSLSCVPLFATPMSAAHQASLFFMIYRSWLRFMSIESMMLSNHLILCLLPSVFPSIRGFSNESILSIKCGASASTSVLSINIQAWFPLVLTSLISLLSKGLSRVAPAP